MLWLVASFDLVRDVGDGLSVGERVAFYRRRLGLSQEVLAGLVGRSTDWLSKVERGQRRINHVDVLVELSRLLRVSLNDLLGEPVGRASGEDDAGVAAIRDALMSPQRLSRVLFTAGSGEDVAVAPVARLSEEAWHQYQKGALGRVIAVLPQLISAAQRLESTVGERSAALAREGFRVSSRVHHLAATTLSKVGQSDVAWMAAERAMSAADHTEVPLVVASAARAGTHALLSLGRFDEAVDLGQTAAGYMARELRAGDPAALSLFGMLFLRTATAAGRRGDRSAAGELLARAGRAADRLGVDANYWQTGFGPTNVELHRLAVSLDLGEVARVVESGPRIRPDHLPVERQVAHAIDLARAASMWARDGQAVEFLLDAEQKAPQLMRHSSTVRGMVRTLYRRAPVSTPTSSPLWGLAQRCQAA